MITKSKLEAMMASKMVSGKVWNVDELLDTISALYQQNEEYAFHLRKAQERLSEACKQNEELKKIKGLCGPGGCAHLPPNHYEALLAVAKAAEDAINCPQFLCDDLDRANLESALAALREGK